MRSDQIQDQILKFIASQVDDQPQAQLRRNRDKLRRNRVRVTLVDLALGRAIDAGILPPAEDAPEKDWAAFFEALLTFLEGLADVLLRLFDAFPSMAPARAA